MKVKCEYCDNLIPYTAQKCPICGAPNRSMEKDMKEMNVKAKKLGGRIGKILLVILAVIAVCGIGLVISAFKMPDNGYYLYQDTYYYTQDIGITWYEYDGSTEDWFVNPDVEDELKDHWKKYIIFDLEEGETKTAQEVSYPDIRDSQCWIANNMDETAPS